MSVLTTPAGPTLRRRPLRLLLTAVAYLLPPALLTWWLWEATAGSTNYLFPPLSDILTSLRTDWFSSAGLEQIWPSLRNLLVGYAIASVLGIAAGAWLGVSIGLRQLFLPVIDFARSVPPPVLLPLGVVLLGIDNAMKVAVIAFGCIWPTLYGAMEGVRSTEPVRRSMSAVFRLRSRERWRMVVLPGAAPLIVAGMRSSLQIAFVLIVISELIASNSGIGFSVLQASRTFQYADMWAGAILLGLLGLLLNLIFGLFASRVLRWRDEEVRARRMS